MTMPAMKREFAMTYDDALVSVVDALKTEGFGVLTEIDVQQTFKKKLDVDFRRYKILGACSPQLAHQALSADLDVGVLLPCNVVVYEGDDNKVVVSAVDPALAIGAFGDGQFTAVADEVRARLMRVLDKVG